MGTDDAIGNDVETREDPEPANDDAAAPAAALASVSQSVSQSKVA